MKQYSYRNFREMEAHVLSFCDEVLLFDNYEADDLVGCYIRNILTYHMQDTIISDCLEHGYDEDMVDLMGEIDVSMPFIRQRFAKLFLKQCGDIFSFKPLRRK